MLHSHRAKFSRALLYTSILTACHGGGVQAMDKPDAPNNNRGLAKNFRIMGAEGEHQVTITPHQTIISNVSPEQFSEMMSSFCGNQGFQLERANQAHQGLRLQDSNKQNLQDAISLDPNQNPFYVKGQAVIDILKSLDLKNSRVENRFEAAKARQFNNDLKQKMSKANSEFLNLLKQRDFLTKAGHLSELNYGMNKIDENYFNSMVSNLQEEKKQIDLNNFMEDGYASEYINPKNREARQRFIIDSIHIFKARKDCTKKLTEYTAKSSFTNFNFFINVYLGLVRDTTGGLFARDMALNLTSIMPTNHRLGEEDMKARRKVFSLHYLGSIERTFQILDELKPLAEIAYEVGHKFINWTMIEDHLNFARNALNEFLLKEHGIESGEEVRKEIPTDLPLKPLAGAEKRKIEEHENEEKIVKIILEQQAEKQAQEKAPKINSTPIKIKSLLLKQEEENSEETYKEWFYKTQLPDTSKNLKSEYRTPTTEQIRKEKKVAIKNSKKEKSIVNDSDINITKDSKINEKEEVQIKENIKSVIHSPHKNGSKKLRPEHIKSVRSILLDAGYTSEKALNIDVGAGPRKVFQDIHNLSFSGEMNAVTNMIRALKGHVDETRSGSRIGVFLRHIKTNEIIGTDLLSPGDD